MVDDEPWDQFTAHDSVPWLDKIGEDDWVRLFPVGGLERAELSYEAPRWDATGEPLPATCTIDRKIAPLRDVMAEVGDFYLSERLVRAFAAVGAKGGRADIVRHATPYEVAGHRLYLLSRAGFSGGVVEGQRAQATKAVATFRNARCWNYVPLGPVVFDGNGWNGEDVCLSPWFGHGAPRWRALLVRGVVLRKLLELVPDLNCGLQRASILGADSGTRLANAEFDALDEGVADPIVIDGLVDDVVRASGDATRHILRPGASAQALSWIQNAAPFALPQSYLRLLRAHNGFDLFRLPGVVSDSEHGALRIYEVGAGTEHEARSRENRDMWGYHVAWRPDRFPIGEAMGDDILWLVDARGRVVGAGKDGLEYGPDAAFEVWFRDQVRDLAFAWPRALRNEDRWRDWFQSLD